MPPPRRWYSAGVSLPYHPHRWCGNRSWCRILCSRFQRTRKHVNRTCESSISKTPYTTLCIKSVSGMSGRTGALLRSGTDDAIRLQTRQQLLRNSTHQQNRSALRAPVPRVTPKNRTRKERYEELNKGLFPSRSAVTECVSKRYEEKAGG